MNFHPTADRVLASVGQEGDIKVRAVNESNVTNRIWFHPLNFDIEYYLSNVIISLTNMHEHG